MIGLDMSDVKPSIVSFLVVTLMAIAGISLAKYAVNQFDNPVTQFFRSTVNAV